MGATQQRWLSCLCVCVCVCVCVCACGLDWWHLGDDVEEVNSKCSVTLWLRLLPLLLCEQHLGTLRIHLQNFATELSFHQIRSGC